MKTVLVTGANGQLGKCFRKHAAKYPEFQFLFCSSEELNICDSDELEEFFKTNKIDICINTAAYTNVEQAENEPEKAFQVNAEAAGKLAGICKKYAAELIHFSTDYVFDGNSTKPYSETDEVNPINVYGSSKLEGENLIAKTFEEYFIFRTSWLYSEFGHNFFNTIQKKIAEKAELNITTSQLGTPTNANDLALYVLDLIKKGSKAYGLYHFSNQGQATWYDFAEQILVYSKNTEEVILNKTGFFKTLAKRPEYSVLSKEKAEGEFGEIKDWKLSLYDLIQEPGKN